MARTHWHVNTFQPGCLNDASDGPYTRKADAMKQATWLANDYRGAGYRVTGGYGRYEVMAYSEFAHGLSIIKVEPCDEPIADCEETY